MSTWGRSVFEDAVREARRAPSPHNTQPARFAYADAGFLLYEDTLRRLPVADAENRDAALSLGCALEGMRIALSRYGLSVVARTVDEQPAPNGLRLAARTRVLADDGPVDPLADAVVTRVTYRGPLLPVMVRERERLRGALRPLGCLLVEDRAELALVARLVDEAGERAATIPGYVDELLEWTRLTDGDHSDGMTAASLGLGDTERRILTAMVGGPLRSIVTMPAVAERLLREGHLVKTASVVVAVTADAREHPLASGARFYRAWLEIARAGLSLCPMSALADDERSRAALSARWSIPSTRRLVNVWRVGRAPQDQPLAPRLRPEALIVPAPQDGANS